MIDLPLVWSERLAWPAALRGRAVILNGGGDEQRLSDAQRRALAHAPGKFEIAARKRDDRRALLEPAELLPLRVPRVAREARRPVVAETKRLPEAAQVEARDADRGHRHQRELRVHTLQLKWQRRALVAAEEALDALERDRVHVPGVTRDMRHLANAAVR